MPAILEAQPIDWPGIRAAAVVIGVREAARRAATNLTPVESNRFVQRCLKRSEREGWVKQKLLASSQPLTEQAAMPLSSNVVNGSDSIVSALAEDSSATKIGFSKAARKVAESLPNRSEADLMDKDTAQAAKHWQGVAAASQPGWEQEKKQGEGLVSIQLIRLELPAKRERVIEAEIVGQARAMPRT